MVRVRVRVRVKVKVRVRVRVRAKARVGVKAQSTGVISGSLSEYSSCAAETKRRGCTSERAGAGDRRGPH